MTFDPSLASAHSESPHQILSQLVFPKEKIYFKLLAVSALLFWIVLLISIVGVVGALIAGIMAWFANGLMEARLKSESIRVTAMQFPALYQSFVSVCKRIGLQEYPAFYILQHNGVLNAFASRHSGRNFIVISSDLLEALGHDTPQVRFLIGHELGHIRRNHLMKKLFLLPGIIVSLLGKAYHRACETTCDRFGFFAAESQEGALRGLLALAGGREAGLLADPEQFAFQHHAERGLFVSWHELASNYPTLSQRVSNMLAPTLPAFAAKAPRHFLAYPFAALFNLKVFVSLYILLILGMPAITGAMKKGAIARQQQIERQRLLSPPAAPF